jgi:hypothetical protein
MFIDIFCRTFVAIGLPASIIAGWYLFREPILAFKAKNREKKEMRRKMRNV